MKMITGFLPPTSGKASVCGFDVVAQSLEVRKRVGYLPESNPLYYDMYVREFLEFVAGVHQLGKAASERITTVIRLTGLEPERHKKIGALSNGYKQRVGIAQALLHDPEVLILDEPTTGLDPLSRSNMWQIIKDLVAKGTTLLLTTQYLEEADQLADRIVMVDHGKVIAEGTANELKSQLGGERLEIAVAPGTDLALAERSLLQVAGSAAEDEGGVTVDPYSHHLTVAFGQGAKGLAEVVRQFDAAGLEITDLALRRPTLDEVFLTLTGKPVEETAEGERAA